MTVVAPTLTPSVAAPPSPGATGLQARSKAIAIVAAVAQNDVIGIDNTMPWHLPEDFRHFRKVTQHQTLIMGRTTFDSIGRPLPDRHTIVLTRDPHWARPGVHTVTSAQAAIDLAEDLPGNLMVVGGSHVYATFLPIAQMQIISEVKAEVLGDAYFPPWDRNEWFTSDRVAHDTFDVVRYHHKPVAMRDFDFSMDAHAATSWWRNDWVVRLRRAVERQQKTTNTGRSVIDWGRVHVSAMRVLIEAAEAAVGQPGAAAVGRQVRLTERLSIEDVKALQGALLHWSEFLSPRH